MSEKKEIKIIKGLTKAFFLKPRTVDNDVYDDTDFTEAKVVLPTNNSGSPLIVTQVANTNGSVVSKEGLAIWKVFLAIEDVATLKVGTQFDLDFRFSKPGLVDPIGGRLERVLDVFDTAL